MVALVLVSLLLMQATRNGSDAWLSYWVDNTSPSPGAQADVFFYLVRKIVLACFYVLVVALTL